MSQCVCVCVHMLECVFQLLKLIKMICDSVFSVFILGPAGRDPEAEIAHYIRIKIWLVSFHFEISIIFVF